MSSQRGFTLVEMIVSVGLFAIVSVICIAALLSLVAADRKAQAIQNSMNNLNIALDDLVRNARMGTQFHCGVGAYIGDGTDDCQAGGTAFTFTCNTDTPGCSTEGQRWSFALGPEGFGSGGCPANSICESTDGGNNWLAITSPEVTINDLTFYVVGTKSGCDYGSQGPTCQPIQPRVIIIIQGTSGTAQANTFHLEANAVQRVLDL